MSSFFPGTGMPDRDWWQALWPDPMRVLQDLSIGPGMTVVDLCCGDGYFTASLAALVAPGAVIAVDIDAAMLERAKTACRGFQNCRFVQADARALADVVQQAADCVLVANTFHGVPDKVAMAHSVLAVLRPGGRFVVLNWHPLTREETTVLGQPRGPATAMRMSPAAVVQLAEEAGFGFERQVELSPYHYGVVFTKPQKAPSLRKR